MDYLYNKYKEKNTLKIMFFVVSIVYVILFGIMSYKNERRIDSLLQGMYAIDKKTGVVVKLEKSEYTIDDRVSEYKDHLKSWFKSFYQFDQYTFLDNMEEAKNYMASEDYEIEIDKYRKDKVLEKISEDDLILNVSDLNVDIDTSGDIPKGKFTFIQSFRKGDVVKKRIFEGEFKLKDTDGRTDKNSHAVSIFDYVVNRKENI